jgi:YegS/Rv2252/BmrU family lipid kinase
VQTTTAGTPPGAEAAASTAALIYNPAAGSGRLRRRHLEEARAILSHAGIETELQFTDEPGHATDLAREYAARGGRLVIVSGGDGTINEAVNGLAGTETALAILPCGTANVLAKELGIPWDVCRAAGLIARARPRRIALGQILPLDAQRPARYFICLGGAGPDGVLVYAVDLGTKQKAGVLAYWLEGFRQLVRYPFPHFRVASNGHSLDASLVVVGRTRSYGGPFEITTEASLFRDDFEILAVTTRNPVTFLSLLPAVWLGQLRQREDVHIWKATSLRCETLSGHGNGKNPVYAQVDGEPAGRLDVEFRIVPSALTLLIPSTAVDTRGG